MTNGDWFPGAFLASATVKAAPATPAPAPAAPAAPGVVQPGLVKAGGNAPRGKMLGDFFLELGKMDWSFFFWVGILAYVQFLSLALGWYMKLVHLVLGESFFMDFRDGWISFISNNRGANPKWDTMESHWNSFCSVVSFCFPYALRWFQVMSLAWAKSPATDP